ncbi:NAD(P)-dependent dehydrogenase (short-subunit alcohol dehydrogenase family) [Sphingobium fontiphilum]|uniref:NAD(P)-dependent dehydrogenase (Short-subunit alcohol dehydrogenase family) n=1 Tax=Sphingobium fontiphilum TaxID=944425 RepID=A0A7W6DLD9_9SPHN|nr:NAD(P)-dependent dehydrogenase (short-subunit alcohol dehydrogenase family) [Sphingobium fontiphilum]
MGEHVAKACAGLGANVVLSVRSHDRIAAKIKAADGGRAIAADAGEKADLERLVDGARAAFGPIHILFNNAAAGVVYAADGGLWANTDEVRKTAMDVNVMATWRRTELTEADMKANGKGNIISVQSCGGFKPIPPAVAYGVSKAALLFLVRELAKTLAPHSRINCLCVGTMSPDGQEAAIHRGPGLAERNAIRRFGAASYRTGRHPLCRRSAAIQHRCRGRAGGANAGLYPRRPARLAAGARAGQRPPPRSASRPPLARRGRDRADHDRRPARLGGFLVGFQK